MLQNFQCTSCGHLNTFGEPVCIRCGQTFIYNCPICGSHINNRYSKCRGCGASFNWGIAVQQNPINTPSALSQKEISSYQQNTEQNPVPFMLPTAISQQTSATAGHTDKLSEKKGGEISNLFSTSRFWIILIIVCVVLIALLLIIDRFLSR